MKKLLTIAAFIIATTSSQLLSSEPPEEAASILNELLQATESGEYAAFQAPGNQAFKEGITEEMFSQVSSQMQPVLEGGYDTTYLSDLNQQGFKIYLWKLIPKTGNDEFLLKLTLEGDEAAGFWIQ